MKKQKISTVTKTLIAVAASVLWNMSAQAAPTNDEPLTYQEIVKMVSDENVVIKKLSKRLVGKTVRLHLMPSHPAELKNLVVDINDSIYFFCNQRPAGFKEGTVTAKIVKVEDTPEGDPWITLGRCVK